MGGGITVYELSTKIQRMVGARRRPNEHRLKAWYEGALDLESACRYWEKAVELMQSKIKKAAKKAA